MKRRRFIKSVGALGVTTLAPSIFTNEHFIKKVNAAGLVNNANLVVPARLPQVINIFLYGGPSELAGNLTNIADINANSQNPYDAARNAGGAGSGILLFDDDPGADPALEATGQITPHGFWRDAGGTAMEDMLTGNGFGTTGADDSAEAMLSVYRTINRRKENTRAHRPSILSSQKGNLDIELSGGMGTTIASVLFANKSQLDGSAVLGNRNLEDLVLPFVSFEGESSAFAPDVSASGVNLPLTMRGISLDTSFDNPYSRGRSVVGGADQSALDNLVAKRTANSNSRFQEVSDGFSNRSSLENKISGFTTNIDNDSLLPVISTADPDCDNTTGRLVYPNGSFSSRVKAAVTLAIQNPDSLYITVGGGLGGWDDHDNAIEKYENRMTDLMTTLRVAAKHLKHGQRFDLTDPDNPVANPSIDTDNIIINVHGDFGRNVNLNGSMGWDHGNNQNLYTIGGSAIRGQGALGKVVGKTERFGDSGQNRQFTRPTDDSYEAEPMSIAATVYSYFGVQNPEVLTADAEFNPSGDPKIDETVAGEAVLF